MSWSIDTTIRVRIDDDPQLVARFTQWLSAQDAPELIFDAVFEPTGPATFVFHHDQLLVVRNILLDFAQQLHQPAEEEPVPQPRKRRGGAT